MTAYIIRRLLFGAALNFLATIVSFTIIKASPGMVIVTDDLTVSKQYIDQRKRMFGQDQPAVEAVSATGSASVGCSTTSADKGILEGNLGQSFKYDQPVASVLIGPRLKATLVLNLITLLFTWMLAIPLGTYAAARQYRWPDKVVTVFSFIGMSLPGFFLALLLLWLFASKVQWLPPGGFRDQLTTTR